MENNTSETLLVKGSLEVPGSYNYLKSVRHFVSILLTLNIIKKEETDNIVLVVDEAVANVIEHSYKCDPTKFLQVYIEVYTKHIKIEIIDRGKSFDFDKFGDVDLEEYKKERRKGGLGIYLIKRLIDKAEYKKEEKGFNRLKLIKYLN
ncbi:MAG TPA: ATP-binding protein [bacterium]|nr:ATP-binding protein [bacterium]HPQ19519.1 ATP-binding protein [bacterium]